MAKMNSSGRGEAGGVPTAALRQSAIAAHGAHGIRNVFEHRSTGVGSRSQLGLSRVIDHRPYEMTAMGRRKFRKAEIRRQERQARGLPPLPVKAMKKFPLMGLLYCRHSHEFILRGETHASNKGLKKDKQRFPYTNKLTN